MTGSNQRRAVIDANLIVSGFLFRTGPPHAVIRALYDRRFVAVVTDVILQEYADVLDRPIFHSKYGIDPSEIAGFLQLVSDLGIHLRDVIASPISVRDHLDQKFLDAAITAQADFLVTGDNDLLALAGDPQLGRLRIMKARDFLNIIGLE